jgi:WD40 repeat protein
MTNSQHRHESRLVRWRSMVISVLAAALGTCPLHAFVAENTVEVLETVSPSVVAIESVASSGTGIVLTTSGLVLTNAHVVAAPLRYTCRVEIEENGAKKTVTFRQVKVTRFHTEHDLALIQLDPTEHPGKLVPCQLSAKKALLGQRVYAIGNPSGPGISLPKTITEGLLSGTDRVFAGLNYYQVGASVHPGNSGGPLCDSKGVVLGLVTLKSADDDKVGFAIPMDEIRMEQFVPPSEVRPDLKRADELIAEGNNFVRAYAQLAAKVQRQSEQAMLLRALSNKCFLEALVKGPDNYSVYVTVARLSGNFGDQAAAKELHIQSLKLALWPSQSRPYREFGAWAAANEEFELAETIWLVGIPKYPVLGVRMWEDLAGLYRNRRQYGTCAECAAYSLFINSLFINSLFINSPESKTRETTAMLNGCKALMSSPADAQKYQQIIDTTPANLSKRIADARAHWRSRTAAITPAFKTYLASQGSKLEVRIFAAAEPSMPQRKIASSVKPPTTTGSSRPRTTGGSARVPTKPAQEAKTPGELLRYSDARWRVESMAFSPDERFLAVGKSDDTILILDIVNQKVVGGFEDIEALGDITATLYSPDGTLLLTGGNTGQIFIWKSGPTGKLTYQGKFVGHSSEVGCIAIAADGKTVISGERDKRLRCWNIETQRENFAIGEFKGEILACGIASETNTGYACGRGRLVVFDLANGKIKKIRNLSSSFNSAAAISPNGRYLATASGHDVVVMNTLNGRTVAENDAEATARAMRFLGDTDEIAIGLQGMVIIWDFEKNKPSKNIKPASSQYIQTLATTKDGKKIAVIGSSSGQAPQAPQVHE